MFMRMSKVVIVLHKRGCAEDGKSGCSTVQEMLESVVEVEEVLSVMEEVVEP